MSQTPTAHAGDGPWAGPRVISVEDALRLAREIADAGGGIKAHCAARGWVYSTTVSQCARAGVNLGAAIRAYRVRATLAHQAARASTISAAALAMGWTSVTTFCRARRMVRDWPEWALTSREINRARGEA